MYLCKQYSHHLDYHDKFTSQLAKKDKKNWKLGKYNKDTMCGIPGIELIMEKNCVYGMQFH